jgi:4-aminobutyrate aminotransferase
VPPDGFLQGLRALCDRHGILLIFDEVQSGVGRTGKMFAAEHFGVTPDIMTLAKGLGSGLPIGMMVAKKALMEKWQRGSHGNTYGGNPVCCAAALATLDLVSAEYCANAARMGEYFIGRLRELQKKYVCIGDVRGKGLMLGMELVEDRTTKVPATKLTEQFIRQAYLNGLLLLSCGQSTIRFMPPLMVSKEHVDEAVTILDATFAETQNA